MQCVLEAEQGGQCSWSGVSEVGDEVRELRGWGWGWGDSDSVGLCSCRKGFGFSE